MTRCTFAEMLHFLTIGMVMVSCVVLWNDPMDNIATFTADWQGSITPTQETNSMCPDEVGGPCWYICYNNYIYHDVISTILYENITLTFDIHLYCQSVINGTGQSTFSYATDGNIHSWRTLVMVTNGGQTLSRTETLPVIAENNIAVSIRIKAAENGNDCCCFLANVKLEATAVVPSNDFVISNSSVEVNHSAAMSDCQATYGTDLAMVTSFELNKNAVAICNAFCVSKGKSFSNCGCWIGVYRNENEETWQWQDGTLATQFGFNADGTAIGNVAPWSLLESSVGPHFRAVVHIGYIQNSGVWGEAAVTKSYYPMCNAPTPSPTAVTIAPTYGPTIDPTKQPTNIPTKNPVTNAPTTPLTTSKDIDEAVVTNTMTVTANGTVNIDVNNNVHSKYALTFPYIVTVIACLVLLTAIFGYIHSKCIRINDFFKVLALFAALFQALDLISDIFLALHISLFIETERFFFILFISAIACIAVPVIVSILQLMHQIKTHWGRDDNIKLWLTNNSTMLYFLSICTGSSFTAIQLMNSNLFCLNNFSMGLTNAQFRRYQTKKIYSIVLLENLPQLILQSLFLIKIGQFDEIAVCSMIFSSISIIVTVASMLTAKQMLDSSGFGVIEFEVTGSAIVQKSHVCKNQVSKIRRQISSVLGLNESRLIEVMRPSTIPRGLKLKMYIHLNHIQRREIDYKMVLNKCQQSGELAQILRNSWKLKGAPVCSQIIFTVEESKNRKKNTVSIKVDSDSENIGSDAKVGADFFDATELPPMPKVRPLHLIPTRGGDECEEDKNELIDGGSKDVPIVNGFGVIEAGNQTVGGVVDEAVSNDVNGTSAV